MLALGRKSCIVVTGDFGSGKSTFAVTAARPSEIGKVFVHDSEGSMNRVFAELAGQDKHLGHYVDLRDRFPNLDTGDVLSAINRGQLPWVDDKNKAESMAAYYEFVVNDIAENMKPGKFDYYIIDTLENLEAGMVAWVEAHKKESGVKSTAYGGLYTQGVYPLYDQLLNAIWARGVHTIVMTSHLKVPWEGNRPVVGKYTMSGKKLLYRLSSLMIWLVKQSSEGRRQPPAGLVLKERLVSLGVDKDEDEWNIQSKLPERLPECTWRAIRAYLSGEIVAGHDDREVMSPAERDMIAPLLSSKQLDLMIEEARLERAQIESQSVILPGSAPIGIPSGITQSAPSVNETIVNRIKELRAEGHGDPENGEILRAEGFKAPDIFRAFKALGGMNGGD